MALYDVLHDTTYRYDSAVLLSQQIAHLRPRECAGQHTLAHRLEIVPAPAQRSERSDFALEQKIFVVFHDIPYTSLPY